MFNNESYFPNAIVQSEDGNFGIIGVTGIYNFADWPVNIPRIDEKQLLEQLDFGNLKYSLTLIPILLVAAIIQWRKRNRRIMLGIH